MKSSSTTLAPPAAPAASLSRLFPAIDGYRLYVVGLLWVVMLLRFVDLQIISVLLEPIKTEFVVSDTALGLLTGLGFAVFYAVLGIPVAWLADRSNRRNIIAIALAIWSGMTALCGVAGSFGSLFLARVGVGVGEAGGSAPAYSLVSDYFHARHRATVFATLSSAVPAGVFFGYLIGGSVNASYGWRAAFLSLGLPGLLVAVLVWLTLREPARGLSETRAVETKPEPIKISLRRLMAIPAFRHFVIGSTVMTLGAMGSGTWIASFFIRVHHMPVQTIAAWLAFIYGGGGILGTMLGGVLSDRATAVTGDKRWHAWLPAAGTAAILPFAFFVYLWPDPVQALLVHIGTSILMHMWMGPVYGTIQGLSGVRRRSVAAAVNLLTINLIAYGFGALLVGMLSDYLTPRFGVSALRYAILTVVVVAYSWAAVHFLLAARTLRRDLQLADSDTVRAS